MNEPRGFRIQLPAIRAVLVGARADQQDHVGIVDDRLHVARRRELAEHVAGDAERQGMAFIHRALAHHRGHHRDVAILLQRREFGAGAGEVYATAGDDQRLAGGGQHAHCLVDPRRIGHGAI